MENREGALMQPPASPWAFACVAAAERALGQVFQEIERIEACNQWRVLHAFQDECVAQRHFAPTTGYGYDDIGRDTLERVFARVFQAEDALVRPQIANGTHALYLALSGVLRPSDTMLSIAGKPYDTLEQAIGLPPHEGQGGKGERIGSLREFGIEYKELPLINDKIDMEHLLQILKKEESVRVVYLQRSRGYAWREAIPLEMMRQVFSKIKRIRNDVCIMVDNCYGEFTGDEEPCAVGADVVAGSLIKNPGGGVAPTGGYIAGKATYIEQIANRLTVPGMGREVGSYAGGYLPFYQGLFLAPHVTAQSLKTAVLFARLFEDAGLSSMPMSCAGRSDIIQALRVGSREALVALIRSIQKAAPIDSFVVPEPWDMPGYSSQVIMAAGAFIQGASIELSADAPLKEPYTAYIQGALTYAHGRIGAMIALDALKEIGEIG